ncbi:tRNA (adenosine(37)-N6)-threonylcarbamoyltransferase complex ATPase subunit type 1 TsaE [Desulfovibrio sp. OttesenSCG-928-G15]|nr:tRNA (adenosine(37)-N6)-threonylcarbamoyltransferase complex ATPase subunit type 1 TsaE [Desulfovibrio sp. OttesenSCG-928-G15]
MQPLTLTLKNEEQTRRLGLALGKACASGNFGVLLLYGGLGAGKTTLVRYLVESLPGGNMAEVSSPSFTICNIYCTAPVVHHFDLYRLGPHAFDEALEESLDDASVLTIVEWAENLGPCPVFAEGLSIRFLPVTPGGVREVELNPFGPKAESGIAAIIV